MQSHSEEMHKFIGLTCKLLHRECNEMGGTCKGSVNKIMYAWAMDAPALTLPQGRYNILTSW